LSGDVPHGASPLARDLFGVPWAMLTDAERLEVRAILADREQDEQ
jgi:hypothetical protein